MIWILCAAIWVFAGGLVVALAVCAKPKATKNIMENDPGFVIFLVVLWPFTLGSIIGFALGRWLFGKVDE